MIQENSKANDYALARYLNERVVKIFALVADHQKHDLPDLSAINRSYVLLVHELKQLYDRNSELSSIGDNICWRTFATIDAIDPYTLFEYSDDNRNHGNDHIAKVNSLCIISGKEEPDIPSELNVVLDEATKNMVAFAESWLIPLYTFDITEAGVLLVNGVEGVMNVRKVQAGSPTELALAQAKTRPDTIFKPDLGKISAYKRGLTASLKDMGFKGAIGQLFMPDMDDRRGIRFRPMVTRTQANEELIDLTELDQKLKSFGAKTIFDIYDLPVK